MYVFKYLRRGYSVRGLVDVGNLLDGVLKLADTARALEILDGLRS